VIPKELSESYLKLKREEWLRIGIDLVAFESFGV